MTLPERSVSIQSSMNSPWAISFGQQMNPTASMNSLGENIAGFFKLKLIFD